MYWYVCIILFQIEMLFLFFLLEQKPWEVRTNVGKDDKIEDDDNIGIWN